PDGEELTFRGRIDRIDQGPDGLVAIDYKTGRASKSAGDYRSGAALQLPIYLQAVAQKHEVDPASVEAEYWYATRRGDFVRSGLRGADVLSDEQFWEALRVIRDGIRQGRFFPHPGEARGNRRRPNCTYCDYFSVCSTDVDARFDHKKRLDQPVVREFLSLQARK
ncbi:MAG: PD-(D/E)XK nuclease family protein, partial [Dehalococcoidia bacterium]